MNTNMAINAPAVVSEAPFKPEAVIRLYTEVVKHNPGAKVLNLSHFECVNMTKGLMAKHIPIAAGHMFYRSITEATIPIDQIVSPILPDPESSLGRSAYGIFTFEDTVNMNPNTVSMVSYKGYLYWLDFMNGKRDYTYQFFWVVCKPLENKSPSLFKKIFG